MISLDVSKYEIAIKHHVFIRAMERGIDPDMIEQTLWRGKVERFGKHGIRFVNTGPKRTIICVGELVGDRLKIFTIEGDDDEKMR